MEIYKDAYLLNPGYIHIFNTGINGNSGLAWQLQLFVRESKKNKHYETILIGPYKDKKELLYNTFNHLKIKGIKLESSKDIEILLDITNCVYKDLEDPLYKMLNSYSHDTEEYLKAKI